MSDTPTPTDERGEPTSPGESGAPRAPERTVAGMSMRHLVVGTFVALVVALAAGAIAALSADDEDPGAIIDLAEVDEFGPVDPDDIIDRPVAVGYTTFDGESANTAGYLGTPVVVNLFAEWCAPCRAEMPAFEAVYQERRGEVAFLGLSTDTDPADGRSIIDSTGITYDVGRSTDGSAMATFQGTGMPTTALLDANGIVRAVHSGALTADELRDFIDEHLR
ncbi:MAG: TlpA family protein disulfide reductase [Acidimicrobiia bacterium]|nr:TlpA family protein disulfide reductase [Acidimicrobiia bacterium]